MSLFDYVTIGDVSHDVVPVELAASGVDVGGTVSFSGRIANALGCRAAILTSAAADFNVEEALPDVTVEVIPSAATTSFSNIYSPAGRQQIVHARCDEIKPHHVPETWRDAAIAHLGPITDCIDPDVINVFQGSLVGLTLQGWMRTWGEDGIVKPIPLMYSDILLPRADVIIIGEEDLATEAELAMMRDKCKLVVMTRNVKGCIVFDGADVYDIPPPQVYEVNPTGAGDIFATAFFVRLWRSGGDVVQAAEFANMIASATVAQPDLNSKVETVNAIMAKSNG